MRWLLFVLCLGQDLTDETYSRIRDAVLPTAEELQWSKVRWRPTLWQGVLDAQKEQKPILLWAMNGHPLACVWNNGVISRRSVWSDPAIQELVSKFVPAADEVGRLQRGKGPECALFQKIAEEGHDAGRTKPTGTRQGTYAPAPSGVFLASINSNDTGRMAEMLRKALKRWEELKPEEPLASDDLEARTNDVRRVEQYYPQDGLVLRVIAGDLPREKPQNNFRAKAWNQDFAWFRKDEARRFLPKEPKVGERHHLPEALVKRLAKCHLLGNVRGQTSAHPDAAVQLATLTTEVTAIDGDTVSLRLSGETKTTEEGKRPVKGFADMDKPADQKRGFEGKLLGRAKFDLKKERFVEFELVAAGTRRGGTQYNVHSDDMGPAPPGFVLTLAGPDERVAPAHFWHYGWK